MANLIVWSDIPVRDLNRAVAFYTAVLDREPAVREHDGLRIAVFTDDGADSGACLVEYPSDAPAPSFDPSDAPAPVSGGSADASGGPRGVSPAGSGGEASAGSGGAASAGSRGDASAGSRATTPAGASAIGAAGLRAAAAPTGPRAEAVAAPSAALADTPDPNEPAVTGPLLYLSVDGRLPMAVGAVTAHGGRVLQSTHPIGPFGFRAIVVDSEGNRIALHSENV